MKPAAAYSLACGIIPVLVCCAAANPSAPESAGSLKPCPGSPNCVSTQSADPDIRMAPLPNRGDRAAARDRLLSILADMPRATVATNAGHYLHVEFRSAVFGFVDDVEFVFDDAAEAIHFRSVPAAATGTWGSTADAWPPSPKLTAKRCCARNPVRPLRTSGLPAE